MLGPLDRIKLWSVGGGKGGIGKSLVSLGLGICLAKLGKKVVLIDGDLGGANLHTLMGVRFPPVTLEHFLLKKVSRLEDTVLETQIPGIGLICGADDLLGAANPTYAQKMRLLQQIEALPAQYVILDLGAGTSYNLLDFFNYSPGKIVVCTGQATALQNAYGFIKSALYRKLTRDFAKADQVLKLLYHSGGAEAEGNHLSLQDLQTQLAKAMPEQHARLSQALAEFHLYLMVNMVKSQADLRAPEIIKTVCQDFLALTPEILGSVPYEPAVEAAVNQMNPFPLTKKKNKATTALEEIAMKILKASRLPKWLASRDNHDEEIVPAERLAPQPS